MHVVLSKILCAEGLMVPAAFKAQNDLRIQDLPFDGVGGGGRFIGFYICASLPATPHRRES